MAIGRSFALCMVRLGLYPFSHFTRIRFIPCEWARYFFRPQVSRIRRIHRQRSAVLLIPRRRSSVRTGNTCPIVQQILFAWQGNFRWIKSRNNRLQVTLIRRKPILFVMNESRGDFAFVLKHRYVN